MFDIKENLFSLEKKKYQLLRINQWTGLKAYQVTELKNVEHFKISSNFTPLKFRDILPEAVNSR